MRIIGGHLRGLRLSPVGAGDAAAHLRPTGDRVREAVFNLLINGGYGDPVTDAVVLDLFAGTGALGLEALSRGADRAVFVEKGRVALDLLSRNIALCRMEAQCELLRRDATRPGPRNGDGFTLVFLDPPYGKGMGEKALVSVRDAGWLHPEALIVWEEAAQKDAPAGFERLDARRYGDSWVHILRLPPV
jgi:16S rRNA (guanine966-N2)-methyltransferase